MDKVELIENASIPVEDVQCVALFDQRGEQVDLTGNSTSDCISPSGGRLTMPLPGTKKPGILGGPTYVLIESFASAPQGGGELICENNQLVGTRLWGYDEHTGLDEFSYRASPEKTYDLSWTKPGVVYGGVFREVPPVGGTATLTLTNKAGLSIVQTLFHPEDICKDGGGGSGAGGDHPDDNHSAASPPIPAGEFFALPEGARVPPRVAILNRGSSHGLWQMAFQLGETATSIGSDFDPVRTAAEYPVLLIPSGGLYGLENSPSFRARLEEYARLGGVIVAFAQQHGYEYQALPGGEVGGYGWDEDISCFRSSLYLSEWHPVLSGFDRTTLDVHACPERRPEPVEGQSRRVDGYFDTWPEESQVLLSRRVNGQPGAILYRHTITHYADGAPVWSLFIETLFIETLFIVPTCPACVDA